MAKARYGKLWVRFKLFGLDWKAYLTPTESEHLEHGDALAMCWPEERIILIAAHQTAEQRRTALAHELQHAIEDHADVDFERGETPELADRRSDQLSRGWLYLIRDCPEIVAIFQGRDA